eukprot:scaffold31692_cov68-Phaeocystis_antarctica.AAC.5
MSTPHSQPGHLHAGSDGRDAARRLRDGRLAHRQHDGAHGVAEHLHCLHVGQRGVAVDRQHLVALVQVGAVARDARLVEHLDHGQHHWLAAARARRRIGRDISQLGGRALVRVGVRVRVRVKV